VFGVEKGRDVWGGGGIRIEFAEEFGVKELSF